MDDNEDRLSRDQIENVAVAVAMFQRIADKALDAEVRDLALARAAECRDQIDRAEIDTAERAPARQRVARHALGILALGLPRNVPAPDPVDGVDPDEYAEAQEFLDWCLHRHVWSERRTGARLTRPARRYGVRARSSRRRAPGRRRGSRRGAASTSTSRGDPDSDGPEEAGHHVIGERHLDRGVA